MRGDWHAALAYALTGEEVDVPAAAAPDPDRLLADLAAAGWPRERLAVAARRRRVLPPEVLSALGAARFAATVADLRKRLDAVGETRAPSPRRTLTADERRLLADRPPHWG